MKKQTAKLVTVSCTYEEAINIVCDRGLLHCEPLPEQFHGFYFSDHRDLAFVATAVAGAVKFHDRIIIAAPDQRALIEEFVELIEAESRVEQVDLLHVWFWNDADEAIFNEELGLAA